MISVHIANYRFQVRAAAVVVHEGHVLLHRMAGDQFWALPGGRVEAGEDAQSAVLREMQEELQVTARCDGLLYLVENFFEHAGQPNHELGMYFRVHLPPQSPLFDQQRSHAGEEGDKQLEFRWFALPQLAHTALHPAFLRTALAAPTLQFQHIVQHG